jgi:1-acyl-sn-glycerol-3-phosphate acyltransferase
MTEHSPEPGRKVVTKADAARMYRIAAGILQPISRATSRQDWHGRSELDRPSGLLLVVNHISNYDFLVIADYVNSTGRPVRFLAKESVFTLPILGPMIRGAEQIPVRRSSSDARNALAAAIEAVEAGECVVVYPEGTLTKDPDGWPMLAKTGAARIALATDVPVIPIGQWGAGDVLPRGSARPRFWPRRTVHVSAGSPIDLSSVRGREIDVHLLREVTELFMSSITAIVAGLRDQTPPAGRFDPTSGTRRLD